MELSNKIVLISGGASGLGLEITKALLSEGAIVHVASRNIKTQEEIKSSLGSPNLYTHEVDITKPEQVEEVIKTIGNIDILINNAGVWLEGNLKDNAYDVISNVIDVNTKGVIYMCRGVIEQFLNKNDGFILNISSTSGTKPRENQSVYAASKFAVRGFTDSLKEDLKGTNVKISGFYPGGMRTKLFEKAGFPVDNSKWMDPAKVAQVALFILKQDDTMRLDHVVLNKRI